MTTLLERTLPIPAPESQIGNRIVAYLTALLGDGTLARTLAQQVLALACCVEGEDDFSRLYRLASSGAIETVRAHALSAPRGSASGLTLAENALKRMPAPWYRALVLYAHEGAEYREIGEREGIAEGTAHTRVCRAKRWLWEVFPVQGDERPVSEREIFPFLLAYLHRLLCTDEQAARVAYTAIEIAERRRVGTRLTPFESTQRYFSVATRLLVDVIHEQGKSIEQSQLTLNMNALEGMPERFRRALWLYTHHGEGYASIGKSEGISTDTASVRVSMARAWMREHLVPPDELATAIAAVDWAERSEQTLQEHLREGEFPDLVVAPKDLEI